MAKKFHICIELIFGSPILTDKEKSYIKNLYSDFTEKLIEKDDRFYRLLWRGKGSDIREINIKPA